MIASVQPVQQNGWQSRVLYTIRRELYAKYVDRVRIARACASTWHFSWVFVWHRSGFDIASSVCGVWCMSVYVCAPAMCDVCVSERLRPRLNRRESLCGSRWHLSYYYRMWHTMRIFLVVFVVIFIAYSGGGWGGEGVRRVRRARIRRLNTNGVNGRTTWVECARVCQRDKAHTANREPGASEARTEESGYWFRIIRSSFVLAPFYGIWGTHSHTHTPASVRGNSCQLFIIKSMT